MRLLPSDKYNVAWFKLAEFVSRGEKERALGLYRLLIHSFDDIALAYQLQADLLWAFHDEQAFDLYQKAADAYQQSQRELHAAGVYEQLLTIRPGYRHYIDQLERLYLKLNTYERLTTLYHDIVLSAVQNNVALADMYLQRAVEYGIKHAEPQSHNLFMQRLKELSQSLYDSAMNYSEQK